MCDSPLNILNKSLRFNPFIDSAVLSVPCGKCKSCMQRKQNDWFFRASKEYERCISNGGFVLFPTLTYDNYSLPLWYDKDNNFSCPVFRKEHFVSFRNKLRVYLKRLGFDFTGEKSIRYFYVTEYGGKRGRPHIHCLLFIPCKISISKLCKLVQKAWIYGFVMYSKKGRTIQSANGVSYVMKYLSKDMAWFNDYGIDNYLLLLRSNKDKSLDDYNKYCMFKRCLPHHCQSLGFGSSYCPCDEDFINDKVSFTQLGLHSDSPNLVSFYYHIPDYYKRKYLYDYDKALKTFTINKRGLYVEINKFQRLVSELEKYIISVIHSDYVDVFSNDYPYIEHLPYFEQFIKLREIDSRLIALYMMSFRFVRCNKELANSSFDDIEKFIEENSFYYFISKKDKRYSPLTNPLKKSDLNYFMFNDIPCISFIEQGLQFIECVNKIVSFDNKKKYYDDLYKSQIQFKEEFYF